jgi:insertion element IS1 protein InsB
LLIANTISKPKPESNQIYELDELRTYVGKKTNLSWIAYAIRRDTKEVIDFNIGYRTNEMLKKVIHTLLNSDAKKIYTDKLVNYKYLLPQELHSTKLYGINHIERNNLTLRMHLKRLGRKTICFSKSVLVLAACMKIYFWGWAIIPNWFLGTKNQDAHSDVVVAEVEEKRGTQWDSSDVERGDRLNRVRF